MTKQEYIAKQTALRRGEWKRSLLFVTVLFAGLASLFPLGNFADRHKELAWAQAAVGISLLVVLVGMLAVGLLLERRRQKEHGVRCPRCGRQITNSGLAIAVGNCGFCGGKLFDDEPAREP